MRSDEIEAHTRKFEQILSRFDLSECIMRVIVILKCGVYSMDTSKSGPHREPHTTPKILLLLFARDECGPDFSRGRGMDKV
jgi:hypothetical protein